MGRKALTGNREARSTAEMLEALRRHTRLLREYCRRTFEEGDLDYAGEVAGKLRLLVAKFRSNEPLLLRLMTETGREIPVTLFGPPIPLTPDGHRSGDQVPLESFLQLTAVGIRVPSGEFVELTKLQLIRAWAEQTGAPHEDWDMEPALRAILGAGLFIGGLPAAVMELKATAMTALRIAEQFLAEIDSSLTPPAPPSGAA